MKQLKPRARSARHHQSDEEIQAAIRDRRDAAERTIRIAVETAAPELGPVTVVARMPIGVTGQVAVLRHPHGRRGVLASSIVTCRRFGFPGSDIADVPAPCDLRLAGLVQYSAEWRARQAMEALYRAGDAPRAAAPWLTGADQVLTLVSEALDQAVEMVEPEDRFALAEQVASRVLALLAGVAVSA
ncbi:hypothetical protein B4N89_02510 [Embleya scabrispora]|uniref:Uncharacterized protein n=1 Tax=Embleya scabrispora TaxID=159449 RepID=A0A1T3NT14_9ACTN|nr:hypothetical protein [Embleya scabrispora]OPC79969.1 hypothetical protein B4N89_02510 [Embleya scabrispora]